LWVPDNVPMGSYLVRDLGAESRGGNQVSKFAQPHVFPDAHADLQTCECSRIGLLILTNWLRNGNIED
jgi:hypothetical protein